VGGVPAHDQRGEPFTRVFGGRIDIGAVEAIPAGFLPGDYNDDGTVNAGDYAVWRNAIGALPGPLPEGEGVTADGNGDGLINQLDYAVWKSNYGSRLIMGGGGGVAQVRKGEAPAEDPPSQMLSARLGDNAVEPRADGSSDVLRRRSVGPRLRAATTPAADRMDVALVAWLASQAKATHPWEALAGASKRPSEHASRVDGIHLDSIDSAFAQSRFQMPLSILARPVMSTRGAKAPA
jgi:hypothetical protein